MNPLDALEVLDGVVLAELVDRLDAVIREEDGRPFDEPAPVALRDLVEFWRRAGPMRRALLIAEGDHVGEMQRYFYRALRRPAKPATDETDAEPPTES